MASRDPEVQRVIDEAAIRRLLDNYPRALDRQDHERLASLFHPGAIDDHGVYNGSADGFVEMMKGAGIPGHHWMHHNGTQIIDFQSDTLAFTETYTLAFFRTPPRDDTPGGEEIFLRVRYLDRVEKRDGEWKIAHRRVVYSPSQTFTGLSDWDAGPESIREAGFPDDATYHW